SFPGLAWRNHIDRGIELPVEAGDTPEREDPGDAIRVARNRGRGVAAGGDDQGAVGGLLAADVGEVHILGVELGRRLVGLPPDRLDVGLPGDQPDRIAGLPTTWAATSATTPSCGPPRSRPVGQGDGWLRRLADPSGNRAGDTRGAGRSAGRSV